MSNIREMIASLSRSTQPILRRLAVSVRKAADWLSPPPRLCAALLGLAFLVSVLSLSLGDRIYESVLFFPRQGSGALHGELRNLPRTFNREKKAELIASELLLGPTGPGLLPAFPSGVRVETVLWRHGSLFVDLSADAALADEAGLRTGIAALEKSLRAGLPIARRITLTIGGMQPWMDSLPEVADAAKKNKKN